MEPKCLNEFYSSVFVFAKHVGFIFFFSFLVGDFAFGQQDSVKTDSTHLYENIESYSNRSKFMTFFYKLVFNPALPVSKKKEDRKGGYMKLIQKPYSTFEGKIIRNINIITLDPFGFSPVDTTFTKQNFFNRTGNSLHIKSLNITIQNLLLIRENQPFNSFLVKESERLIRNQKYVHEVYFYVVASGINSDSVDIFIRELDKWSIIPEGSISSSKIGAGLTDQNFLGTGHEFKNVFVRNSAHGINSFNTDYSIPNIRNSFISAKGHLGFDGYNYFTRSIVVERPFFSPVAKWAAGVIVASHFKKDSLLDANLVYVPVNLKFRTQDYWVGKAHQIFRNNKEASQITNLIFAVRYLNIHYSEKPSDIIDPLQKFSSEVFYSASIGISSRKYVQDKFIFKDGVIEDVPVGKVYGLTGGYQYKNNTGRIYSGMRLSLGNYYHWGYLSSNFEIGTFWDSKRAEQGVFTAGINYFTGLFEIGKWKFRQFVKPQVTIGINRQLYENVTLNEGNGLDGFNSKDLSGNNRVILTLQTQSYAPWHFIGFRFGPFLTCSFGMLGDDITGFKKSQVYSQIGLGVLINNENLVFKRFQFSISFFPLIPGIGNNIFKINSFKTTDFGFRDFEIEKPEAVIYQ